MAPIVMITRPEPEATALAAQLAGQGARLVISPLQQIRFHAIALPEAPFEAIFTSRNGVRALVRAGAVARRAWCVGEATARAAREAGMWAMSADGDAEALLALLLKERPAGPLVHLRGAQHRGDLVGRLVAAGLRAEAVEAYAQAPRAATPEARQAMQGSAPVVVPVYSPGAAHRLAAEWQGAAPLLVTAISAAAAAPLRALSPARLSVAARPSGETMLNEITGLIAAAHQLENKGGGV